MKSLLKVFHLTCLMWLGHLTALAQAPAPNLLKRIGGTGLTNYFPADITTDQGGNSYAIGFFTGTIEFGGGIRVSSAPGQQDAFLVKHDPNGTPSWAKRMGAHKAATTSQFPTISARALGVASVGNHVYVLGSFNDTINFNTPTAAGSNQLVAVGNNIFIAQYNTSGALQWARRTGCGGNCETGKIAAEAGAVYFATNFATDIDFNTPPTRPGPRCSTGFTTPPGRCMSTCRARARATTATCSPATG
jgi:hypothetical protein